MCGIAGIVSLDPARGHPPATRAALLAMAYSLDHRGPDEVGLYRDDHAGLAHARLSIIDVATGQQPMGTPEQALWVVFNGEIFNHLELRAELEQSGHRFRTRSDTEVLLHAYQQWGDAAFARCNGQWAVALWDAVRRRLVLSRDPVGICPLFLCEHQGRVHFASEVKAIFAGAPSIPRQLDPDGIDQTFTFWTAVPPRGVWQGIMDLRPGHVRVYENGGVRETPYTAPGFPESEAEDLPLADGPAGRAAVAELQDALESATMLRMLRADVPVGCYLSGGLDSSLVAALGRRFAGDRFNTFSLRFADAEYDETEFQRVMVKRLGSAHHEIVVSRADIAEAFPAVVFHGERPLLRTAPAPLFLLSRAVRAAGIKAVLTGEGADEMFAGYDIFREGKIRRFWARQPGSTLRPRLLERLYPYLARSPVAQQAMARQFFGRGLDQAGQPGFAHGTRWRTTAALKRLFAADFRARITPGDCAADLLATLPEAFGRWTPLAQDQHIEIRTLLAGYLLSAQGDRMLMAHSIEGRFPFLDQRVVALAERLPAGLKLRVLNEKFVVKQVARDLIDPRITARPKQPYRAPDALSFVAADRPAYINELLSESALRSAGVFDPEAVSGLWGKCLARAQSPRDTGQFSNADNMAVVGVLSTQLLHHHFVRGSDFGGGARQVTPRTDVDRTAAAQAVPSSAVRTNP